MHRQYRYQAIFPLKKPGYEASRCTSKDYNSAIKTSSGPMHYDVGLGEDGSSVLYSYRLARCLSGWQWSEHLLSVNQLVKRSQSLVLSQTKLGQTFLFSHSEFSGQPRGPQLVPRQLLHCEGF